MYGWSLLKNPEKAVVLICCDKQECPNLKFEMDEISFRGEEF